MYIGYFHQLMVCSRGRGKTKKYTNIRIRFSENNSRNQVHAIFFLMGTEVQSKVS